MTFPTWNGDDGIFRGSVSHLQERARYRSWREAVQTSWSHPGSSSQLTLLWPFVLLLHPWEAWGFSSRRPETAESPLHMDHLLLTIIFTVQLWPLPSLYSALMTICPSHIVEINGAVNQDLCGLMLLYASVIDMLLRAVKSYLRGHYSNMLLLLLSYVISKSLGH